MIRRLTSPTLDIYSSRATARNCHPQQVRAASLFRAINRRTGRPQHPESGTFRVSLTMTSFSVVCKSSNSAVQAPACEVLMPETWRHKTSTGYKLTMRNSSNDISPNVQSVLSRRNGILSPSPALLSQRRSSPTALLARSLVSLPRLRPAALRRWVRPSQYLRAQLTLSLQT